MGAPSPFTLIQDGPLQVAMKGLVERLRMAFPPAQFTHHVVPARLSRSLMQKISLRAPFLAVGFISVSPRSGGDQRRYKAIGSWTIYLGLRNLAVDGLLAGDAFMPGQLGVLSVAIAAVHGWTQPGLGTWSASAAANLYSDDWVDDALAVVGVDVSLAFDLVDEAAAAALPEFLRLGATWPFDPPEIIDVRAD